MAVKRRAKETGNIITDCRLDVKRAYTSFENKTLKKNVRKFEN
jgi:hypothetical protein